MKNKKTFIYNYLIIIFLELILKLFTFKNIFMLDTIYIFLYSIPIAFLLTLINKKIIYLISIIIITFLYEVETVYYQLYNSIMGIDGFMYTNQVMGFKDSIIRLITIYIIPICLLLVPIILIIIFYKRIELYKLTKRNILLFTIISLLVI